MVAAALETDRKLNVAKALSQNVMLRFKPPESLIMDSFSGFQPR
jgi:hypothetical protein